MFNNIEKILLLATNHVGNNIFCTPAIRLLKKHYPKMQLDVIAMSSRGGDVFKNHPDINHVYITARKYKICRLAKQYPLVIGLHPEKSQQYLSGLNNIVCINPFRRDKHRAEETLEFMQKLLNSDVTDADRNYVLTPQPKHFAELTQHFSQTNADDILIGLHLGGGKTAVHGWKVWYKGRNKSPRLWPLTNYINLAKQLQQTNPHIRIVITGSRFEKFLAKKFIKQVPNTINLIGATSLLGLTALMQHLHVYITQDNGTLHVACATAVPLIGLFGPTEPEITGPYPVKSQHTIIKKNNMQEISPEEVHQAVLQCLT